MTKYFKNVKKGEFFCFLSSGDHAQQAFSLYFCNWVIWLHAVYLLQHLLGKHCFSVISRKMFSFLKSQIQMLALRSERLKPNSRLAKCRRLHFIHIIQFYFLFIHSFVRLFIFFFFNYFLSSSIRTFLLSKKLNKQTK